MEQLASMRPSSPGKEVDISGVRCKLHSECACNAVCLQNICIKSSGMSFTFVGGLVSLISLKKAETAVY